MSKQYISVALQTQGIKFGFCSTNLIVEQGLDVEPFNTRVILTGIIINPKANIARDFGCEGQEAQRASI